MRDVLQYFDLITKIIELSPTVSVELDLEQFDQKRGTLEGIAPSSLLPLEPSPRREVRLPSFLLPRNLRL